MEENPGDRNDDSGFSSYGKAVRAAGPLFTAGIQMAAAICGMGFFGYIADQHWHTSPWLMVAGLFFGAGGGLYLFIRTVMQLDKSNQKSDEETRGREN